MFSLILGLPEAPTALFIAALSIVLVYYLLSAYTKTQKDEIDGLRTALKDQAILHRTDMVELNDKVDRLEADYLEQRAQKHKAFNDVARTTMALDLVKRLAKDCSCNVLEPLQEIITRLLDEMETLPNRRIGDQG